MTTDALPGPTHKGGDGYSEDWDVPCPGCSTLLEYQRILAGPVPGRWLRDDSVLSECPECGVELGGVEPDLA